MNTESDILFLAEIGKYAHKNSTHTDKKEKRFNKNE